MFGVNNITFVSNGSEMLDSYYLMYIHCNCQPMTACFIGVIFVRNAKRIESIKTLIFAILAHSHGERHD
jgi:hypothetical protein